MKYVCSFFELHAVGELHVRVIKAKNIKNSNIQFKINFKNIQLEMNILLEACVFLILVLRTTCTRKFFLDITYIIYQLL